MRPTPSANFILRLLCLFALLAGAAQGAPVIVIDAGHGGHDRGGMPGQRIPEEGYTLDVAKRLDSLLRSSGFRTVLTRRSDTFVSLDERCAISNRQRNAVFISIHFNGARNADASGIETYYCRGKESAALAVALQRKIVAATGAESRFVRSRNLRVLRGTRAPAVLCELGFLTNRGESRRIVTASYRQRLAAAIASVVVARYR